MYYKIREKATGEFWCNRKGKETWKQVGHAKAAWANLQPWRNKVYFDDQDEWEIVKYKLLEVGIVE